MYIKHPLSGISITLVNSLIPMPPKKISILHKTSNSGPLSSINPKVSEAPGNSNAEFCPDERTTEKFVNSFLFHHSLSNFRNLVTQIYRLFEKQIRTGKIHLIC